MSVKVEWRNSTGAVVPISEVDNMIRVELGMEQDSNNFYFPFYYGICMYCAFGRDMADIETFYNEGDDYSNDVIRVKEILAQLNLSPYAYR